MNHLNNVLQQALACHQAGQWHAAEQHYQQVLQAMPTHVDARHYLGVLYHQCGQPQDALTQYDQVISLAPGHVDAWSNRTQALVQLERLDDALRSADSTLKLAPQLTEALFLRAHVLRVSGRLTLAIQAYQQLLQHVPQHAQGWLGQGLAHAALQQHAAAVPCFQQVIKLQPDDIDAHNNLGVMLQEMGALKASLHAFDNVLVLKPGHIAAHVNRGVSFLTLGDTQQAQACFEHALALDPGHAGAQSHLLYLMCFDPACEPARYLKQARHYGQLVSAQVSTPGPYTQWPAAEQHAKSSPRLRIGFVSGDLRNHSVGHFLEGLLQALDTTAVELVAYHTCALEDTVSERLRSHFSAWHPVHSMGDAALAEQIHQDGIQILVDLSGHTAGHRLPVFAWRPAPVQLSWLGYLASTGVPGMDYLLADAVTAPLSHAHHFTETLWHLPHTANCLAVPRSQPALEVTPLPALDQGHITFGCFQTRAKMNANVLRTWAELLHALPASRLLIQSKTLSEVQEQAAIMQTFGQAGIAPDRITIEGGVPTREDVLRNYQRVDIALDTFPYPGITTTCEALWMGVPVLTMCGDTLLSRQGASLLSVAGLPAWVTHDTQSYVQAAVQRAQDLPRLAQLRSTLRAKVLASPLFDTHLFANDWLDAMRGMWNKRQSSQTSH